MISASEDRTLQAWDLASGRLLATFEGHTRRVTACAVTPDGHRLVSVSGDRTLRVWDLDTCACLFVHRGDVAYTAVAATATTIIAGDSAGTVWFLDLPPSPRRPSPRGVPHPSGTGASASAAAMVSVASPAPRSITSRHVILFLATNPSGTTRLDLDDECAAIELELSMMPARQDFDFHSKWAVSVDAMMRHLNELQPTVIHFSGHGGRDAGDEISDEHCWAGPPHRDVAAPAGASIYLEDERRQRQPVNERALAQMIASAAPSTRVVVLNACYSDAMAEALCNVVDGVVGMRGAISDGDAQAFAVGFYRALGNRCSVGNAIAQARAVMAAKQLSGEYLPACRTRDGVDAEQLILPSVNLSGS